MVDQSAVASARRFLARAKELQLPVRSVILYGSYARGEQHKDSDIDLLVEIDDAVPENEIRSLWTELGLLAITIDSRIETIPVTAKRLAAPFSSALVHAARTEGIAIAA